MNLSYFWQFTLSITLHISHVAFIHGLSHVMCCDFRQRDTLVVDHSKAGLHKVMKELELNETASSNQVYKVRLFMFPHIITVQ